MARLPKAAFVAVVLQALSWVVLGCTNKGSPGSADQETRDAVLDVMRAAVATVKSRDSDAHAALVHPFYGHDERFRLDPRDVVDYGDLMSTAEVTILGEVATVRVATGRTAFISQVEGAGLTASDLGSIPKFREAAIELNQLLSIPVRVDRRELATPTALAAALAESLAEERRYRAEELEDVDLSDPWGRPYEFRLEGADLFVTSLGRDGAPGGEWLDADIVAGSGISMWDVGAPLSRIAVVSRQFVKIDGKWFYDPLEIGVGSDEQLSDRLNKRTNRDQGVGDNR